MPDPDSHLDRSLMVAWAAGFMDGEGCFTVRKNGPRSRIPTIQVGQNDRPPLERLQYLWGGSLYTLNRKRIFYTWEVNGGAMLRAMLPELIPHLVGKKRQAELLLEYSLRVHTKRGGYRLPDHEIQTRLLLEHEISALKRA